MFAGNDFPARLSQRMENETHGVEKAVVKVGPKILYLLRDIIRCSTGIRGAVRKVKVPFIALDKVRRYLSSGG